MLRDYQNDALRYIRDEYLKGTRKQIVVMACGTGKTQIFSHLPDYLKQQLPGQTLVLAHRIELIDQAIDKLRKANPTLKVSKEMSDDRADTSSDIIVASTATLGIKDTERAKRFNWESIDKVITDECHRSSAQSYQNIYDMAGINVPGTHKLHVGFTASPSRSDGKALSDVYEKVVYNYGLRSAIEAGWLVDVRGYRVKTTTSLENVSTSGGDFQQTELSNAVNNPSRNQTIVKAWLDKCEQRTTVAFCVDIKHAMDLSDAFEQAGVPSVAVWGDDKTREEKLAMLREGKIKVLCNCAIMVEGVDIWQISCVILAKPSQSNVFITQACGRSTRLEEGTGNLKLADPYERIKRNAIILDIADNFSRHSLVTLPTLMGLPNSLDLNGRSVLQSVKSIEEAQLKSPAIIDFSKLDNIDNLKTFIEQVDLFTVRFPKEVQDNSELVWFSAVDGGYKLNVPKERGKPGQVRIFENLLNQWEIVGSINEESFHGVRTSVEEAFKAADEQVRGRVKRRTFSLVRREAKWTKKKASADQMALLKKVMPWRNFPDDLTSGQASLLLKERFNK